MTNVYRQRLSGPAVLGTSISFLLADRPAYGVVGRLVYITDTNEVQLDTGTQWVTVGSLAGGGQLFVNTPQSLSAAGTITISTQNRQAVPISGNGGPVTANTTTAIAAGLNGYELILIGQDDTNTVTLDETTANLTMNGPITLYNGAEISFVYYNTKWIEISRST